MKVLVALAALLLAAPASAEMWVAGCTVSNANCTALNVPYDCCSGAAAGNCPIDNAAGVVGKTTIRGLERGCWTFVNADGTGVDGPTINVTAEHVRICLNDDLTSAGATTVAVDINHCPDGGRSAANPTFVCTPLVGTTPTLADNGCVVEDAGLYSMNVTAACVAADVCQVSFEGIDPQRQ